MWETQKLSLLLYQLPTECPHEPNDNQSLKTTTHKHTEIHLIVFEDFSCKMACISTGTIVKK